MTHHTVHWRSSVSLATLLLPLLLASCGGGNAPSTEPETPVCTVQSVTLSPNQGQVKAGESVQLTATPVIGPAGCTGTPDTKVIWQSSDTSKATVSTTGTVQTTAAGNVTITATVGDKAASASLVITAPPTPVSCTVQSVALAGTTERLEVGRSAQVTATPQVGPAGCVGTANTAVTWSSSDPTKATVDANGMVRAISAGTVTLTAQAGGKSASFTLTVTTAPVPCTVQSVQITPPNGAVQVGQTLPLTAQAVVGPVGCVGTANTSVVWSSSDTTKATVSESGVVTARAAGPVTITAKIGDKAATAAISVTAAPVSCTVQSVTLSPASDRLEVGRSMQLVATPQVGPSGCVGSADTTVSWSSSDPSKATVDATGTVRAVAAGTAVITARAGDKSAAFTFTLTVTAPQVTCAVQSVSLSPANSQLSVGQTVQLAFRAVTGPVGCTGTPNLTATWTSSDTGKATVSSSGLVTAVTSGDATITVTVGGKSATALVSISAPTFSYPMTLAPAGNLLILQVPSSEFADLNVYDHTKVGALLQKYSQAVLAKAGDQFDNIFFIMNQTDKPAGMYYGVNYTVSNDVTGIGMNKFSRAALYGSAGKLKSVMHMTYRRGMSNGPTLHEFAHNWGNFVLETAEPSHWGFSSVGGQLGGFDGSTLKSLGNNTYQASMPNRNGFGLNANGGNSLPYAELELYLMGMLDASQVRPITVAKGAQFTDARNGIFTATSLQTVTIQDIIAKYGPRTPDLNGSQKEFRVLNVLITAAPATDTEIAEVSTDIELFSRPGDDGRSWTYNFWEATRGLGKLNMGGLTLKP